MQGERGGSAQRRGGLHAIALGPGHPRRPGRYATTDDSGAVAAKTKGKKKAGPITGRLSKSGYTVIALAPNGEASTALAQDGRFRLVPLAGRVTLHLRNPDGTYAGPFVLDEKGNQLKRAKKSVKSAEKQLKRASDKKAKKRAKKALKSAKRDLGRAEQEAKGKLVTLGVKAGAKLGKVKVKAGRGYAITKSVAKKWLDIEATATARKGVPIGAGNFGRVRVKKLKGGQTDPDRDGIPNEFDIDDNGNLVLDNLDPSRGAGASRSATPAAGQVPGNFVKSILGEWIWQTANANATGSTEQQAEANLEMNGYTIIAINPGDLVELDCRGLIYCSAGGTGRVFKGDGQCCTPRTAWPRFPDQYDSNGNGLGELTPTPGEGPEPKSGGQAFFLSTGATTAQIGTGDVLIERVTTAGVERDYPAAIRYIFATVPALVSYSDGQGNSAAVSYPVHGFDSPGPPGPGALENPFPVSAGPGGDVIVTMTLWRPQRTPVPGEAGYGTPGAWTDIGNLAYALTPENAGGVTCPQSSYSTTDPNLSPIDPAVAPLAGSGFTDGVSDRPANPGNTLTYTVNLSQCLASVGMSFAPGDTRVFQLNASACGENSCLPGRSTGPDQAGQQFAFRRM